MNFHILSFYIYISAVPLHEVKVTLFLVAPIFVAGSYVQLSVEKSMLKELFDHVTPSSYASEFRTPDVYV